MPGIEDVRGSRIADKAGLLDGLRAPAKKPNGGHGFIVTMKEDAEIRRGGTPSRFSRDKDGNLRAKVQ